MTQKKSVARAFSEGGDARLAGQPRTANPYQPGKHRHEHDAWLRGWAHCDRQWAKHARWLVRPLPPVLTEVGDKPLSE